ncbi:MAG: Lrp/AsnC family transcriptional regulator, partial [Candidatus Verstraetearchaeota archaeon]|nr:Lrp/AsnC family transcriptional regulator [Candidatus Verstraetearchaeota archaeon]
IKKLESLGIIRGYTTLLDPYKLGFELTALILMQVDGAHIVEVEREIAKHREVCGVYDITGDFDILVIARFRTREELNNFIKSVLKLPHIKRTVTSIALNIVKENFKLRI